MKKTLCLVLCVALLAVVNPVFFTEEAVACEGDDWGDRYREDGYAIEKFGDYRLAIKDGEATLLEYDGWEQDIVIEAEVGGYPIVAIDSMAFAYTVPETLVIPEGVKEIGGFYFFNGEDLRDITLPSTLRIIHGAFEGCDAVEKMVIPEGVEEMHGTAFAYCLSLKEVVLPSTLKKVGGLFDECPYVETVILPEGLEEITGIIFYDCKNAKSVEIPSTVKHMTHAPVVGCEKFEELTFAPGNEYLRIENNCLITADGVLLQGYEGSSIPAEGITAIGAYAFCYADWLTEAILGDEVTSVGTWAFLGCENLTKVSLPEGITAIESQTFQSCTSLAEFRMPSTVTKIGSFAFHKCKELSHVDFPPALEELGRSAFNNSGITSTVLPDTITSLGTEVFYGCKNLETLRLPVGLPDLGESLLSGCSNLKELVLPKALLPSTALL